MKFKIMAQRSSKYDSMTQSISLYLMHIYEKPEQQCCIIRNILYITFHTYMMLLVSFQEDFLDISIPVLTHDTLQQALEELYIIYSHRASGGCQSKYRCNSCDQLLTLHGYIPIMYVYRVCWRMLPLAVNRFNLYYWGIFQ